MGAGINSMLGAVIYIFITLAIMLLGLCGDEVRFDHRPAAHLSFWPVFAVLALCMCAHASTSILP